MVLGSVKLFLSDVSLKSIELSEENVHELSGVRSGSSDSETEETGISEVRVDGMGLINEGVLLGEVLDGSVKRRSVGRSEKFGHNLEDGLVGISPLGSLEGNSDGSVGSLSPVSEFSTDVLRGRSLVLVLRNGEEFSKSLLGKGNKFVVVVNAIGDDEALLGGDVIDDEVLEHSSVDGLNISFKTVVRHTEGVVSVSSSKEEIVLISPRVELREVLLEGLSLSVLGLGNIGREDRLGLESAINHHLEHIGNVVFDAVSSEVSGLLIEVHLEFTSGHLSHTVVDSLVSVLKSLEICVLDSHESSGSFGSLVSGSDVHHETEVNGSRELGGLSEDSESIVEFSHVVFRILLNSNNRSVVLKRSGWVIERHGVSKGGSINGVEDSVDDSRVGTEASLEGLVNAAYRGIVSKGSGSELAEHIIL